MNVNDLRRACKVAGATLEQDSGCVYQAIAPPGAEWVESGSPHLRVDWELDPRFKSDAIADAISRIASGYERTAAAEGKS